MAERRRPTPAPRPRPAAAARRPGTPRYKILHAASWVDFIRLVDSSDLDGWAFRGNRRADWPLITSLGRYLSAFVPDRSLWAAREARSIRIFRRKAHHFINHADEINDDLGCLALMQHHGAPTRLLDFTKSPYVGAFFALSAAEGDAAVWAINTPALFSGPQSSAKRTVGAFQDVDPRKPGRFEKFFLPGVHPFVWAGEPVRMNRRLTAQSGTFIVPGVIDRPLDEILSLYADPEHMLAKIILPASIRATAMRALYRMNITFATLFPDLDGLARSLAYELETEWRGASQRRHDHPGPDASLTEPF